MNADFKNCIAAWFKRVTAFSRFFFVQASRQSEHVLLILFALYLSVLLIEKINWIPAAGEAVWLIRLIMVYLTLWGGALYLYHTILDCMHGEFRKIAWIPVGFILFALTAAFRRILCTNIYMVVMDAFFCLMVCGKSFRKMICVTMWASAATLASGIVFSAAGLAEDMLINKPGIVPVGHSLGVVHPNTCGHLIILVCMILWYLYLNEKRLLTIVCFWGAACFMYLVPACKTAALTAAVFPVLSIAAEALRCGKKIRPDPLRHSFGISGKEFREIFFSPGKALAVILPVLLFLAALLLCSRMDWIHFRFYNTPLHSFAMRFVEGGASLRQNGIHLFGRVIDLSAPEGLAYAAEIQGILDCAYIYHLIRRGLIWVILCLGWLSYANAKCIRDRNGRLLLISVCILSIGLMERLGLNLWYNFVLLYPLADVRSCGEKGGVP